MSKQQSVATCSGLGSEFRAKLSVVTFADDDEEAHYEGELKRDELDSFCKYAGLPSNRIASDQDGRTGYDHERGNVV